MYQFIFVCTRYCSYAPGQSELLNYIVLYETQNYNSLYCWNCKLYYCNLRLIPKKSKKNKNPVQPIWLCLTPRRRPYANIWPLIFACISADRTVPRAWALQWQEKLLITSGDWEFSDDVTSMTTNHGGHNPYPASRNAKPLKGHAGASAKGLIKAGTQKITAGSLAAYPERWTCLLQVFL